MTEPFPEPDPALEGQRRREAFFAKGQVGADNMTAASMRAYAQSDDRRVTQAGQAGMYGHMTPYDRGAANAALPPTVGSDYGRGRPLERLGGTFGHQVEGPAPARVDLRNIDQQGREPGISPLLAYMRGQQ